MQSKLSCLKLFILFISERRGLFATQAIQKYDPLAFVSLRTHILSYSVDDKISEAFKILRFDIDRNGF